jgi:hypothetical protein
MVLGYLCHQIKLKEQRVRKNLWIKCKYIELSKRTPIPMPMQIINEENPSKTTMIYDLSLILTGVRCLAVSAVSELHAAKRSGIFVTILSMCPYF